MDSVRVLVKLEAWVHGRMVFLGAIIGSLGGFLLFKSVRKFRLEERLGREGVPAAATVTHVVQRGYRLRTVAATSSSPSAVRGILGRLGRQSH